MENKKPQTNLENFQNHLEKVNDYKLSELQKELIQITELVDLPICDILLAEEKIRETFKGTSQRVVIEAIREGALGKYGSSYRLDIQEIGRWIYKKLEDKDKQKRGSL